MASQNRLNIRRPCNRVGSIWLAAESADRFHTLLAELRGTWNARLATITLDGEPFRFFLAGLSSVDQSLDFLLAPQDYPRSASFFNLLRNSHENPVYDPYRMNTASLPPGRRLRDRRRSEEREPRRPARARRPSSPSSPNAARLYSRSRYSHHDFMALNPLNPRHRPRLYSQPNTSVFTRFLELGLSDQDIMQSILQRIREAISAGDNRLLGELLDIPPTNGVQPSERPEDPGELGRTFRMKCAVCWEQPATIVTGPCGHCVLCKWCADIQVPPHRTRENEPSGRNHKCIACRKLITHRYTIYGPQCLADERPSGPGPRNPNAPVVYEYRTQEHQNPVPEADIADQRAYDQDAMEIDERSLHFQHQRAQPSVATVQRHFTYTDLARPQPREWSTTRFRY